ncbi:hypothetical protein F511_42707 [Dorcoceras hygrometricum]|uniref:Uncharacterized protein n=1 Tax=Dorcoceras hygrometricum TaxID=472368 RepID=A0A2Z7A024_9LAMI|nr:hypothetical protein F511_42707 [Dorcoceras hygrometricum]
MNISRKKLIAQRRKADIYVQAVGSQYYRSAVGLVFMESAVELAMETSRVDSVVCNQAVAKKPAGSCIEKLAGEEEDSSYKYC